MVVLVLLVIAVAAVLLRGQFAGERGSAGDRDLAETFRRWQPARAVRPAEVRSAVCWDEARRAFELSSGAACHVRLPNQATRISLCVADGPLVRLRVKGARYPGQVPGSQPMSCAAPLDFSLYDPGSVLTMICGPLSPCLVQLR